jgi:hypothetical protein
MTTGAWGAQEPQGPGWYQASDGLWYPPTDGGGALVAQPPGAVGGSEPVAVDLVAPPEVDRWRPLVHWLLVIPHLFVALFVFLVAGVCSFIAFFQILFTRRISESIEDWIVRAYRYGWQITSYTYFMREEYPAWGSQAGFVDPGVDPARLTIRHADELMRFGPLYKWILAIPHFLVLWVLSIVAGVVVFIAFFAVIFTGSWPEGMRAFVVGYQRWAVRVYAYCLLRDEYPPFSLD